MRPKSRASETECEIIKRILEFQADPHIRLYEKQEEVAPSLIMYVNAVLSLRQ